MRVTRKNGGVMAELPIVAVLPELIAALAGSGAAVLVAPPGAGKTTVVPPALLDAGLAGDLRMAVLQPRRVAARATAQHMARSRGGRIGDVIGYHVRFDRRIGAQTRIEVLTEGLLTRRLQTDPFVSDLGLVVLDEFHERSVHADLALALLAEVRREVRSDLRLLVMSATMDPKPVAAFLGDCPIIEAAGRPYPVSIAHAPAVASSDPWRHCAATIAQALRDEEEGDVLVFLPGMGEIRRVQRTLGRLAGVVVLPLHGALSAAEQDRALAPNQARKVVLATNVAETSLTIDGVRVVIDSGLARSPRYDAALGLERLETGRICRASADQRAGRAGRTGPGRCIRLWSEPEDRALRAFDVAEIRRTDPLTAVLQVHAWGGRPDDFDWFEAPGSEHLRRAETTLHRLGALKNGALTTMGRVLARLPVPPRLGRVLIAGHTLGRCRAAAAIAALASERDIFAQPPVHSGDSDLALRLEVLDELDGGAPVGAVSRRWGLDSVALRRIQAVRAQLERAATSALGVAPAPTSDDLEADLRSMLLAGFPDRVGRRRPDSERRYHMVGGHGAELHPDSAVRDAPLIVAVSMEGGRRDGTHSEPIIRIAAALNAAELTSSTRLETRFDPGRQAVLQHLVVHHHGLPIDQRPAGAHSDPQQVAQVLAVAAAADPERALDLDDDALALLNRLRWLAEAMPELALPRLTALGHHGAPQESQVEPNSQAHALRDGSRAPVEDDPEGIALLNELCAGRRSFADLRRAPLVPAIRRLLGGRGLAALEKYAPERLALAAGGSGRLQYSPGRAPVLRARIQQLFGTTELPRPAGDGHAVVVHLLAPNGRPAQVTSDLAGFWTGAYLAVRRELRGRYPKHPWPERPTAEDGRRRPQRRRKT